jgi:uncharacterized membrane protein YagU involved in acid resistance
MFDQPLTKKENHLAGVGVHYAFGATSGALYGAVAELAPLTKIAQGTGFGLGVWFAGVEVAIPLLGLSEPPWRYPRHHDDFEFV